MQIAAFEPNVVVGVIPVKYKNDFVLGERKLSFFAGCVVEERSHCDRRHPSLSF